MKIIFVGVGDAFDENYPNNSHLLIAEHSNILFDCGYSVPRQWWRMGYDRDFLDAIYISHRHADHFFGLPIMLMRMWEDGRTKPITIISQKKMVGLLESLTDVAYKGFLKNFKFKIKFIGVKPGKSLIFNELSLSFAPTIHSIDNLAVRVTDGKASYCYSGDGQFIKQTEELYKSSDLLIQETYLYDEKKSGHACITDTLEMAERLNIKTLALTHLNRYFRKNQLPGLKEKIVSQKVKILIPEPSDEFEL